MNDKPDAHLTARRLADRLLENAQTDDVQTRLGTALALMYAGTVLGSETFLAGAHRHVRDAAAATSAAPLATPALFGGAAGFAWTLAEFARLDPRYRATARTVGASLARQILAAPDTDGAVAMGHFDVISGAAGQLASLLRVVDLDLDDGAGPVADAVEQLLGYLMDLTADQQAPHWFVAPGQYPSFDFYASALPHGMYNLGFAHGLPGVIAALTAAAASGVGGEPVRTRIHQCATWLLEHRLPDGADPGWAWALGADPDGRRPVLDADQPAARTAWCYGAPGVAVALSGASAVTGDESLGDAALAAMRRAVATPDDEARCFAPTLCHGKAGVLSVLTRFARLVDDPALRATRDVVLADLCASADDRRPYLFADQPRPGTFVDDPGLLTGAAGVLLALLGTLSSEAGRWDELMFLAPALPFARRAAA